MRLFVIAIMLVAGLLAMMSADAAIDRSRASSDKKHHYIEHGTIIGGEAGTQTSLLGLRRLFAQKDGIERLVFDMGDNRGKPLQGQLGYFHVSLDRDEQKLVLVLEQTQSSAIDQVKMAELFKTSPFVKAARILFDPLDRSITIELKLKQKIAVEAYQLPSNKKASRLIVDLQGKKS